MGTWIILDLMTRHENKCKMSANQNSGISNVHTYVGKKYAIYKNIIRIYVASKEKNLAKADHSLAEISLMFMPIIALWPRKLSCLK